MPERTRFSLQAARGATLAAALATFGAAAADELGRLFTSPLERSALNQLRLEAQFARPAPPTQPPPRVTAEVAPRGPSVSRLELNGIVKRSRGPATVWVNGGQVDRGQVSREGLTVEPVRRASDGVRVHLPSGHSSVRLKPGQAVDVSTGTLVDAWEARPNLQAGVAVDAAAGKPAESNTSSPPPPTSGEVEAGAAGTTAAGSPGGDDDSQPRPAVNPAALRAISALPPSDRAPALKALRRGETPQPRQ